MKMGSTQAPQSHPIKHTTPLVFCMSIALIIFTLLFASWRALAQGPSPSQVVHSPSAIQKAVASAKSEGVTTAEIPTRPREYPRLRTLPDLLNSTIPVTVQVLDKRTVIPEDQQTLLTYSTVRVVENLSAIAIDSLPTKPDGLVFLQEGMGKSLRTYYKY